MRKYYLVICIMFFSFFASADDLDNKFEKGPLYLKWDDSIQDVQFLYPNGLVWPSTVTKSLLTYSVSNNLGISWLGIIPEETRFSFNSQNKLSAMHMLFKNSDLEVVRAKCLEILGLNFKAKESKLGKEVYWKINSKLSARLITSTNAPYEWVVLSVATEKY